jgi:probable rRNA maturation factor
MTVQIIDEQDLSVDMALLRRLVEAVLDMEGYRSGCMVDVTLVTDCRMTEMNSSLRGCLNPTDVLAVPLEVLEYGTSPWMPSPDGPPLHLGDVVVAPDYVNRQTVREGWDFAEEMGLMVVHGVLHLLGYRHDSEQEASRMEHRERQCLAREGLRRR